MALPSFPQPVELGRLTRIRQVKLQWWRQAGIWLCGAILMLGVFPLNGRSLQSPHGSFKGGGEVWSAGAGASFGDPYLLSKNIEVGHQRIRIKSLNVPC